MGDASAKGRDEEMAEDTFSYKLFSGRGLEAEGKAQLATVPSVVGQLGFLPYHCEYVGLLETGVVEFTDSTLQTGRRFVVTDGIITFQDNTLTLLADSVITPESVDRAAYAKDRETLEDEKAIMSTLDPKWESISTRLMQIKAIDEMLAVN